MSLCVCLTCHDLGGQSLSRTHVCVFYSLGGTYEQLNKTFLYRVTSQTWHGHHPMTPGRCVGPWQSLTRTLFLRRTGDAEAGGTCSVWLDRCSVDAVHFSSGSWVSPLSHVIPGLPVLSTLVIMVFPTFLLVFLSTHWCVSHSFSS